MEEEEEEAGKRKEKMSRRKEKEINERKGTSGKKSELKEKKDK